MTAPAIDAAAEEMTLDTLLDQLGDVSDDHVSAGIAAVQSRAAELRAKASSEGLKTDERDEAKSLSAAYTRLVDEQSTRAAAAAEVDEALGSIPDTPADDETAAEDAPAEPQADAEPAADAPAEDAPAEQTAEPVTAATKPATTATPRLPLGTVSKNQPTPATPQPESAAIVAAAGDARKAMGDNLTAAELYEAIDRRRQAVGRGYGGTDDKVVVASIQAPSNPDRTLSRLDTDVANTRKLDAVTEPQALTAAGVCAPYVIDYSIDAIGSTARPVRDAFPQFTADRGGVQFRRNVDSLGAGPISATGTWSMATDATPGGNTKPIWEVSCNTVISAEVTAITYGLKFSNVTNRFDPEAVAANTKAAAVAHARYAEMALLNSMYSQVTATFTQAAQASAGRDILVAFDKAQAYVRNNRRQGADVTLRTFLPLWVRDLIRSDMTRAMHTANEDWLGMANSQIEQWFTNRGIQVTWMIDGRASVTASGTGNTAVPAMDAQIYAPLTGTNGLPAYPTNVEFPLFVEGTFVFLDGGSLDVGVVRDQALVQTNRYIQFQETWEGLYRKGVEAIRVVQGVQPTGGSSGTITPSTLAS